VFERGTGFADATDYVNWGDSYSTCRPSRRCGGAGFPCADAGVSDLSSAHGALPFFHYLCYRTLLYVLAAVCRAGVWYAACPRCFILPVGRAFCR